MIAEGVSPSTLSEMAVFAKATTSPPPLLMKDLPKQDQMHLAAVMTMQTLCKNTGLQNSLPAFDNIWKQIKTNSNSLATNIEMRIRNPIGYREPPPGCPPILKSTKPGCCLRKLAV